MRSAGVDAESQWPGTLVGHLDQKAMNQTNSGLTLRIETEAPQLTVQAELNIGIRRNTQQPGNIVVGSIVPLREEIG